MLQSHYQLLYSQYNTTLQSLYKMVLENYITLKNVNSSTSFHILLFLLEIII